MRPTECYKNAPRVCYKAGPSLPHKLLITLNYLFLLVSPLSASPQGLFPNLR